MDILPLTILRTETEIDTWMFQNDIPWATKFGNLFSRCAIKTGRVMANQKFNILFELVTFYMKWSIRGT